MVQGLPVHTLRTDEKGQIAQKGLTEAAINEHLEFRIFQPGLPPAGPYNEYGLCRILQVGNPATNQKDIIKTRPPPMPDFQRSCRVFLPSRVLRTISNA